MFTGTEKTGAGIFNAHFPDGNTVVWRMQVPCSGSCDQRVAERVVNHFLTRAVLSTPHSSSFVFSTTDLSLIECKMISTFNKQAFQHLERGIHFFFQSSEPDIYGNSCVLCGHLMICDGKDT